MPNNPVLTDQELLLQFSKGDAEALQIIVKTYFPILCRFAEKYLPDASLAKDIVQETFIKLWQYEGSFETPQGLKNFLFTVTRNGCLNLQRGRERAEDKHNRSAALNSTDPESIYDDIARLEYIGQIYRVVQQMPAGMKQVFLLSFEEGLSIEEIASKMKTSSKTVRNQKYKSLVILRDRFGNPKGSLLLVLGLLLK